MAPVTAFDGSDRVPAKSAGGAGTATVQQHKGTAQLRPDHKLVFQRQCIDDDVRIDGVRMLARSLADIALADAA